MHHKRAIRVVSPLLWLVLSTGLSGAASAEPYAEAMSALGDGEHRVAFRGFKRLAAQDHAEAQYRLGMLYLSGQGVGQDIAKGIEWLKRAANNSSYLAANELGQIYLAGRNVPPDEREAVKWVELATRLAEENPGQAEEDCE